MVVVIAVTFVCYVIGAVGWFAENLSRYQRQRNQAFSYHNGKPTARRYAQEALRLRRRLFLTPIWVAPALWLLKARLTEFLSDSNRTVNRLTLLASEDKT